MRAREQVTGPGGDAHAILLIIAMHRGVKVRQGVGIIWRSMAQDQSCA